MPTINLKRKKVQQLSNTPRAASPNTVEVNYISQYTGGPMVFCTLHTDIRLPKINRSVIIRMIGPTQTRLNVNRHFLSSKGRVLVNSRHRYSDAVVGKCKHGQSWTNQCHEVMGNGAHHLILNLSIALVGEFGWPCLRSLDPHRPPGAKGHHGNRTTRPDTVV